MILTWVTQPPIGKLAVTQLFLPDIWSFWFKWSPNGSHTSHTMLTGVSNLPLVNWPQLNRFLPDFRTFWLKWKPNGSHRSHVILTGVMQPPLGKFAITLPFCHIWHIFGSTNLLHSTCYSLELCNLPLENWPNVCNFCLILDILFQIRP